MSDPVHDLIRALKPLFKNTSTTYTQTVLSKLTNIFTSEATARVFTYFCLHGASTAWVLQHELNMPEATVYRTIKKLHALEIIAPVMRMRKVKHVKGGPRPTIWALEDTTPQEVVEARRLHHGLDIPRGKVND